MRTGSGEPAGWPAAAAPVIRGNGRTLTRWKHVVAPWLLLTFLVGAAERGSPPESGAAGGLAAAVQASPLHPAPATVGGVAQHPATIGPPQTSTLWLPPLRPAGEPAATCSRPTTRSPASTMRRHSSGPAPVCPPTTAHHLPSAFPITDRAARNGARGPHSRAAGMRRRLGKAHHMSILALLIQADDGLTLSEVVRDIPHDGPSIVVYVLVAMFLLFIWWGSRKKTPG
jgi:hypothetical protein